MFTIQALLAKVNHTSSQDRKLPSLFGPGMVAACKSGVKVRLMVDGATFPAKAAWKWGQARVCLLFSYLPVSLIQSG